MPPALPHFRLDQRALTALRGWRIPKERDLGLGDEMSRQAGTIRRLERSMGSVSTAWQDLVPPALAERTALVGISRGVLTVRAGDASTRFELDRWLRSGGELAMIRRCVTGLTRIRVTV